MTTREWIRLRKEESRLWGHYRAKKRLNFGSINYLVETCNGDFFFLFETESHSITLVGLEFYVYQDGLLPLHPECWDAVQIFRKLWTVMGITESSNTEAS